MRSTPPSPKLGMKRQIGRDADFGEVSAMG
jgi:hypothetical protein